MARPPRPRRLPAPFVAQVGRVQRRVVPRPTPDRDLQLVERARQLQRPPARPRRVGEARRPPGRRLPARVPRHLARGVVDEADHDAVPEPDGDGRRGIDPRLSAGRRRPPDRLRQDQPGVGHGHGERGRARHRRHRRPHAERQVARRRPRFVLGLLALPRGAACRPHRRAAVRRDRGRHVTLARPLHDDGDRVDDGLRDGRPGSLPARDSGHSRCRFAPEGNWRRRPAARSWSWSSAESGPRT